MTRCSSPPSSEAVATKRRKSRQKTDDEVGVRNSKINRGDEESEKGKEEEEKEEEEEEEVGGGEMPMLIADDYNNPIHPGDGKKEAVRLAALGGGGKGVVAVDPSEDFREFVATRQSFKRRRKVSNDETVN